MAKKTDAPCTCVEQVNAQLRERGGELDTKATFDMATGKCTGFAVMLKVVKTGKSRKALPWIAATYCPFCGVKRKQEST